MTGVNGGGRRPLRTISVACPALSDAPVVMREPRVRDFLAAQKAASDEDRAVILLGAMVLGDDGNPVGQDAVLDFPAAALSTLTDHIGPLIGEGSPDPLVPTSGSGTA
jgi:hypothetical protein